jgi:hypothetical protein
LTNQPLGFVGLYQSVFQSAATAWAEAIFDLSMRVGFVMVAMMV